MYLCQLPVWRGYGIRIHIILPGTGMDPNFLPRFQDGLIFKHKLSYSTNVTILRQRQMPDNLKYTVGVDKVKKLVTVKRTNERK